MQARGLFALSCFFLTASLASAGQQFKFVDLAPPSSNSFVSGTRAAAIYEVTSGGVVSGVVSGVNSSGQAIGQGVVLRQGGNWVTTPGHAGTGVNAAGDIVYNGGFSLNGYYDYNTGGTVRYADGTEYVLPPLGTNPYACARDINDSGIVVGHYSFYKITNYVEFNGGQPFYMKNGVIMKPFGDNFYGTFCGVDKFGRALLNNGGWWSPDGGYVAPYTDGVLLYGSSDYNQRPDFNDNMQILSGWTDLTNYAVSPLIVTPNQITKIPYASFVPIDWAEYSMAGINNSAKIVTSYRRKIVNNQWQWQWCYWNGTSWEDLYTAVKPQVPAGWLFDKVADIDDFGRIYGTMKKPDGSMTIVRLDPVPEPATLATLALGALLLRRKKPARTRAA